MKGRGNDAVYAIVLRYQMQASELETNLLLALGEANDALSQMGRRQTYVLDALSDRQLDVAKRYADLDPIRVESLKHEVVPRSDATLTSHERAAAKALAAANWHVIDIGKRLTQIRKAIHQRRYDIAKTLASVPVPRPASKIGNASCTASYDYRVMTAEVSQDDRAAKATIERVIHILKKMGVKKVAIDQLKWTPQGYITHLCIDTPYATKRDAKASGRDFDHRTNKFGLHEPVRAGLKAVFGAFTGGFSADNLGPEAAPLKRIFITAATDDPVNAGAFVIDGDLSQGSLPF